MIAIFSLLFSIEHVSGQPPTYPRRPIPEGVTLPDPNAVFHLGSEILKLKAKSDPLFQQRFEEQQRQRQHDLLGTGESVGQEKPAVIPGLIPRGAADGVIYRCFFDQRTDQNQDAWPDGWTRRTGLGFPEYLSMEIVRGETPVNLRALHIKVEGENALIRTPVLPIQNGLSYTVRCFVKSDGLQHSNLNIHLSYLDSTGTKQVSESSVSVPQNRNWRLFEVGPIPVTDPDAVAAQIVFHVVSGNRQDLTGNVYVAGVELIESPTVEIDLPNQDHLFYYAPDGTLPEVEVRCRINGLPSNQEKLVFTLENPFGQVLHEAAVSMRYDNDPENSFIQSAPEEMLVFQGRGNWVLPIASPGFYRVRVATEKQRSRTSDATLAVLEPATAPRQGDYGWSLPDWSLEDLKKKRFFLTQTGISWLKIPTWLGTQTSVKAWDELAELCEWYNWDNGISLVGLLSRPPQEVRKRIPNLSDNRVPSTAEIFCLAPEMWYPSVEPSLMRLTLVRYWQLGDDEDRSITQIDPMIPQLQEIRKAINTVASNSGIGFGWDWNQDLPESFYVDRQNQIDEKRNQLHDQAKAAFLEANPTFKGEVPASELPFYEIVKDDREFVSLSSDESLTYSELEEYLIESENSNCERFVVLRPIEKSEYSLENRLNDLVQRMLTSKIAGAKAVFISEPINTETGLFNADGTPGELFLPWRTTALMISGKRFIGSVKLPNRSSNMIFTDENAPEGVMVIWNDEATLDEPVEEILYLGQNCELVDLWGRRTRPFREGSAQMIPVGPVPGFVLGVNNAVTRFRQAFALDRETIPSQFGPRIPNGCTFVNNSSSGFGGTMTLIPPATWKIEPQTVSMTLSENESFHTPFSVILTPRAVSGPQPFQVNFKLEGAPQGAGEFSAYETIHVGTGDVYLEPPITHYNPRTDSLEIRQALINDTDQQLSFRCSLLVKGRQAEMKLIRNHGFGRNDHVYIYRNARNLIGRDFTLTVREVGGPRTLKSTFKATE